MQLRAPAPRRTRPRQLGLAPAVCRARARARARAHLWGGLKRVLHAGLPFLLPQSYARVDMMTAALMLLQSVLVYRPASRSLAGEDA